MSYEHGTTHYNLPQTTNDDTRDWFDTNEAFRAVDEALYSANQTAGQATEDIELVKTDINNLKDADTAMTGRVDGIESRVTVNDTKIQRLENATVDNKQDLMDAICSIEEASATAAYRHDTSDFFWYNDTLYKATANIAIGQQIVPDTNCKTTNITTELLESGQGGVEIDDTVVSATKVWSSYKTNNEISSATATKTGQTRYSGGKLQYYNGTTWINVEIGGVMPKLDFRNPLHSFTSGNLTFTATKDCYLVGGSTGNSTATIAINSTIIGESHNYSGAQNAWWTSGIKLSSSDIVTVSSALPNLHVFEEV